MEARLKMIAATDIYPRWGGACIASRSAAGYNMTIDVGTDEVILGSIFDFVSFPMNTTDSFHTYRAEASNNYGRLFVDDVLRLEMPLSRDNNMPFFLFGDQGWEGGEMDYQFARYGVPEPASASLLGVVAFATLSRRRRGALREMNH
jgi:hypothetical protein